MISEYGTYYLYRHIRHDANTPFYIGIGKKEDNGRNRITTEYRRAYVKCRNKYWGSITKSTKYTVEILLESEDKGFIEKKEKEFILLYGRKDNGTGVLANMTDGGDYYPSNSNKGKPNNSVDIEVRRERMKRVCRPKLGTNPVNVFVYDKFTGLFLNKFPQIKIAASWAKLRPSQISRAMSEKKSTGKYIFYKEWLGDKCSLSMFIITKSPTVKIISIDPSTLKQVKCYDKLLDASKDVGIAKENIHTAITKGIRGGSYYWKYDDGKEFIHSGKRDRSQAVQKIDAVSGEIISCYKTIKDASLLNGYKHASGINTLLNSGNAYKGVIWRKIAHNN